MPLQNFLRQIHQSLLRVPLRVAIVVPFMLQISAAVGLTAYFSLRNGQKAVNEVAAQLRKEVITQIHHHLSDYMRIPQLVTQINTNAIRIGELNLKDAKSLERHFWYQIRLFNSLAPIAFSTQKGEIHSVDRDRDGSLIIRVIDRSTRGSYHTYTTDSKGNRVNLIRANKTFDPRFRPWYVKAVKAGQLTWTEIYPYFSSQGLAISATQPLYDDRGALLGVTNATQSLSQLGDFLRSLKIGRSGQTFIIERSGNLVASSTTEPPFILSPEGGNQRRRRLAATDSSNPITRLSAQHIKKQFGNFNNIHYSQQLDFKIDGKQQFIQLMPFTDSYGLDWVIVVVIPEADFMEYIDANTRITILLCLGALIAATIMGVMTSHWITQPILRVSSAFVKIAEGKLDQTVTVQGINELRVLAQAHNTMAAQLQASFTALEQANQELELRVEQRTLQLKQAFELEAMLKRVTDKVRDSLDETQILQTVVQELTDVLAAECCAGALYDLEQKTLVIDYEYAQPHWPKSQGNVVQLEDFPGIHQSLLQKQSLQFCQLMTKFDRPHAAVLACPVFDDQGVLADIWLFRQPSYSYNELEIRLVQQVANQCAIGIRQARLYQAAQTQLEKLKNLHLVKDDFLSTVSHELRTPISNMKLAIQMLNIAPTQQKQQKYIEILQAECDKELDLINDLLDMQRLEANRYSVLAETIVLHDWIPRVIEPFQARIQHRQQILNVDLSPEHLSLMTDSQSLERLLAELLNNACKYTPSGGSICLNIKLLSSPNTISFEVCNQAEIPATELPRIFEKFYRVPNADPWRQGGTGLGLALVQKLVEQLEGELRVESSVGWTTFTIVLRSLT